MSFVPFRYDYEDLDLKQAEKIFDHLRSSLATWANNGSFGSFKLTHADDFGYRDPIDQSISKQQVSLFHYITRHFEIKTMF